jgi:hypothetical protein
MTTVIFVHGTSVREPDFSETLKQVKAEINKELPEVKVIGCSWGSSLGAKLNTDGASIPLYDSTKSEKPEVDVNMIRWRQLYQDPLYELKLLSLRIPQQKRINFGGDNLGNKLDEKVQQFTPSEKLENELQQAGILTVFDQARQTIIQSVAYKEALVTVSEKSITEHRDAITRSIIAQAIAICEEQQQSAPVMIDASVRDEVVKLLSSELYKSDLGIGDWLTTQVLKFGTNKIKDRRGDITDNTSPMVGDILLYQGRGQKIRDFIESYIKEADEDVVLIAHSLGGIACVDLLVEKQLEKVKLLVTVGSQAPYFYEINALQSLEYGEPLPQKFPSWLNIYDLNDFLSYIGGNIFPDKVQDILVDNKQPFLNLKSHGSYWTNKGMWKAIIGRIKAL